MANQIKITADTSEVKKSILDLNKTFKDIKGSKIAVFSGEDKKFIKSELKKELALMKSRLKENRDAISDMVEEQQKMVKGSQEELAIRKKILDAYKVQAKLGRELGETQKAKAAMGVGGGGGGGILSQLGGMLSKIPGLAVLATAAMAISKSVEATNQYTGGAANRVALKGLGAREDQFGTADQLARVGLTEQDMIQRRIEATRTLGREGGSTQNIMKQAGFERAFGLEGGTMTGIATQLRGQQGGKAASETAMKLQASVLASGIEDAIGPYLETTTKLLSEINENGTTQTDELIGYMAQLTKDGQRTPEQIAKTFASINSAVQNATGEKSAFLQMAFAKAGIGGGTIGGTKFAMESGGVMGLNKEELAKRGYSPALLANMEKSGMLSGMGQRTGAVLNQFKAAGGLKAGQSISGVSNANQMVMLSNLANNVMGTKGLQGFEALKLMEQVQNKKISRETFDKKMKQMQEENDPVAKRLDDINNTLAGQTDILTNINTNLMENLGKGGAVTRNILKETENTGIQTLGTDVNAINSTGAPQAAGGAMNRAAKFATGGFGGWLYDKIHGPSNAEKFQDQMQIETPTGNKSIFPSAKDIGKEVANAMKQAPMTNNNKVVIKNQLPDGKITERTTK